MEIESLIKAIIQCAYNVRTHLAAGFLENVYQKAFTGLNTKCGMNEM